MIKIGEYELYSIETSEFGLDGGAMFGIIPKPLWVKKVKTDKYNRIEMVTRSLLLSGDGKNILIDTGNGDKWLKKENELYNISLEKYNIESGLKKYGFTPEVITDVICTHLHFDHVGGNTKFESGKLVPTFPNATYWVSKENWKLANYPSQKDAGSFIKHNWEVLAENGMLKIVDGKDQFINGVEILISYGHTDGLMHPLISDGKSTLFFGSDIFPLATHVHIPWVMAYDIKPLVTLKEKEFFLRKIFKGEWILFFEHDPHIQAAKIHNYGDKYTVKEEVLISE